MTDIVAFLHNFDEAAYFVDNMNEFGQIASWFVVAVPVPVDQQPPQPPMLHSILTSIPLLTPPVSQVQPSALQNSLNSSILSTTPMESLKSSHVPFPQPTPADAFKPANVIYLRIEGKDFNKQQMIVDKYIKASVNFVFINENKIKFDFKPLQEIGVQAEAFREYRRENPTLQNFMEFYRNRSDKDQFLFRLCKLINILTVIRYTSNKANQRLASYWFEQQEADPPVLFKLGPEIDRLTDEDLMATSNLLTVKEKLIVWSVNQCHSPVEKFETFAPLFNNLTKGFQFVNEQEKPMEALLKICFLNYFQQKNMFVDRTIFMLVHQRISLLNHFFKIDMLKGYVLDDSVLEPRNFRFPEDLGGFDKVLQPALGENLNSFISNTDALIEQCVASSMARKSVRNEFDYRMVQAQFWLSLNQNLKYQNKILAGLKVLKERMPKLAAVREKLSAMEIQFFVQMKYYKDGVAALVRLLAEGSPTAGGILAKFRKMIPEAFLKPEKIDSSLLKFNGLEVKTSSYGERKLALLLDLAVEYSGSAPLTINELELRFTTNLSGKNVISQIVKSLVLTPDIRTVEICIAYDETDIRGLTYLTIADISFKIENFSFFGDLSDMIARNVNFEELPVLWVNSSGFVNKLTDGRIFHEKNSPNYYFIEFSLFDHKTPVLSDLKVEFFKSSKYVIIDSDAVLVNGPDHKRLTLTDNGVSFHELHSGRYVLLLKVYLLYSKIKNYEISVRVSYAAKRYESKLNLKTEQESYFYVENEISSKGEEYKQVRFWNTHPDTAILLHRVDERLFDPPKQLLLGEELSLIMQNKEEFKIEYELTNLAFSRQPIHAALAAFSEAKTEHSRLNGIVNGNRMGRSSSLSKLPESPAVRTTSKISGKISIVERFVFNKDMTVKIFEIKNRKEVQIYEQNQFVFAFKFESFNIADNKKIFIELDWDQGKYCILGKTKFVLNSSEKIKTKEITFIPYDSGFLEFPRILLVEQRDGCPEMKHLINKPTSGKTFFVREGVTRAARNIN